MMAGCSYTNILSRRRPATRRMSRKRRKFSLKERKRIYSEMIPRMNLRIPLKIGPDFHLLTNPRRNLRMGKMGEMRKMSLFPNGVHRK